MLFGPSSFWDGDSVVFDVSGIHDIMTMYFSKNSFDPFVVTKGINQVFIYNPVFHNSGIIRQTRQAFGIYGKSHWRLR